MPMRPVEWPGWARRLGRWTANAFLVRDVLLSGPSLVVSGLTFLWWVWSVFSAHPIRNLFIAVGFWVLAEYALTLRYKRNAVAPKDAPPTVSRVVTASATPDRSPPPADSRPLLTAKAPKELPGAMAHVLQGFFEEGHAMLRAAGIAASYGGFSPTRAPTDEDIDLWEIRVESVLSGEPYWLAEFRIDPDPNSVNLRMTVMLAAASPYWKQEQRLRRRLDALETIIKKARGDE